MKCRSMLASLCVAVALLLAPPVVAQDYGKGLKAYQSGDYATAMREWKPLAGRGHARPGDNDALCRVVRARIYAPRQAPRRPVPRYRKK